MKTFIVSLISGFFPLFILSQNLTIKGSDTMAELIARLCSTYTAQHGGDCTFEDKGSIGGLIALLDSSSDIVASSVSLKVRAKLSYEDMIATTFQESILGYDVIVVVTSSDIKIDSISSENLYKIFTGNIKNWAEIGGPNLPIAVATRDTASGTRYFFDAQILHKEGFVSTAQQMATHDQMATFIANTPGSIGYISLSKVGQTLNPLLINFGNGAVSYTSVDTYKLARPLFVYHRRSTQKQEILDFVKFLNSDDAKKMVKNLGFFTKN